ncbi:MAG: hypothetical protein ACTHVY_08380 [Brevibacterium yomogidense]|uniref:Uncharacterized protein n=2 Tax=Brevibacterium jeotgali TaxID=1262550 RepID=A0A2H1L4K3_9MICO|nr:hypothetical protein FB108_2456 [Brevibacterium jeotgali]SMY11834.1 hypothetical protein BJEO58_01425 [Brevibacterium jeotgali]
MIMDVLRAWVFGAVAFLALDLLLGWLVPYGTGGPVYFLCPFLAGLVASAVHLWKGEGGWGRHAIAVLGVPVLLALYYALFTPWNTSSGIAMDLAAGMVFVITASLGAACVHLTQRFVLVDG